MKIRILKASSVNSWYYDNIGKDINIIYNIMDRKKPYSMQESCYFIEGDDAVITELPELFCVKRCDDKKWKKYIDWLNKEIDSGFSGCSWDYYGISEQNQGNCSDKPFRTEIHIDDIIKHINYMEDKEFDMESNLGRLAYARKNYVEGSECKLLDKDGDTDIFVTEIKGELSIDNIGIYTSCGYGYVYHNESKQWADIIKEEEFDMNTEEGKLAYAKKYYTIGTKVISLYHEGNLELIISSTNFKPARTNGIQASAKKGDGTPTSLLAVIYENGKWADIIKEETNTEKQKLSRQGLKEIHGVACPNWKDVLEQYGSRNPLEDYIELSQEEVNNMFNACTKDQLPIVSKYLKQDDGSVGLSFINNKKLLEESYDIIGIIGTGDYAHKSFWLTDRYNWEIKKDSKGQLCLIPTKKK